MSQKDLKLGTPTPCFVCEKALMYVPMGIGSNITINKDCVNNANTFSIIPNYGSAFDGPHRYLAIVCDECLDTAIQSKRVSVEYPSEV